MILPSALSGQELRWAFERTGLMYQRQEGSHLILRRDDPYSRVVIPDHKTLKLGPLRDILNQAGLTVDQLLEIL